MVGFCAVAVSIAFTTSANSQNRCPGWAEGEYAELLKQEIRQINIQIVTARSKLGCSPHTLELRKQQQSLFRQLADFAAKTVGTPRCPASTINLKYLQEHRDNLKASQDLLARCQAYLDSPQKLPGVSGNRTGASTPYPFDCKKRPIDASVAWYYTCNPEPESANLKKAAYRHPITPQALYGKAWAACREKPAEQQRDCIDNAKLRVLLTEDAIIRDKCGSLPGAVQVVCVDRYYLYGPDADSLENRRAWLREVYDHQERVQEALRNAQRELDIEDLNPQLSPTRQAYVTKKLRTYNDASLGKEPIPAEIESAAKKISSSRLSAAENLFDRVVRDSVDLAIEANKTRLSENDSKECAAAAYRAVWAVMAGTNDFKTPTKCADVVSDSVAQLAYQAAAQFTAPPSQEEDLLKHYLALRYANTGGRNDGTLDAPLEAKGLTPDEGMRKEGERLLKKQQ